MSDQKPSVAALDGVFRNLGLTPVVYPLPDRRFPADLIYAATLSGEILGTRRALVRASEEICRVAAWVSVPVLPDAAQRLQQAESLLALNFGSTFGRVSAQFEKSPSGSESVVVYVETAFFWQYAASGSVGTVAAFSEDLKLRLRGFHRLIEDVVLTLSAPHSQPASH